MINAVGIGVSNTSTAVQVGTERVPVKEEQPRIDFPNSFSTSRIRVDNLLDVAILEIRSHDTGDVIRQFPTEQQIASFQRAAELENSSTGYVSETINTAEVETVNEASSSISGSIPQTSSIDVPTPAPVAPAPAQGSTPIASSTSVATTSSGQSTSSAPTQSIVV